MMKLRTEGAFTSEYTPGVANRPVPGAEAGEPDLPVPTGHQSQHRAAAIALAGVPFRLTRRDHERRREAPSVDVARVGVGDDRHARFAHPLRIVAPGTASHRLRDRVTPAGYGCPASRLLRLVLGRGGEPDRRDTRHRGAQLENRGVIIIFASVIIGVDGDPGDPAHLALIAVERRAPDDDA